MAGAELLAGVRAQRAANGWRILREFADLLALDNVTGDLPALRRNAEAIAALFAARGLDMEACEHAEAAPLVVGHLLADEDAPTLGVYVHYDGQPVDAASWRTPPFEPRLRAQPGGETVAFPGPGDPIDPDWRLFARSAADDKAPLIALASALDALRGVGATPRVNLVCCFEGEEESGSTHLRSYLETLGERLRADAWLICDGPVHQTGVPQIVLGVRGYCGFDLTVYGPRHELHSGHYGNWVPNPALELAHVLASCKDASGRVTIDGFYDDTRPPSPAERRHLAALPSVEKQLRDELGIAAPEVAEARLVERLMLPSFNVRGLAAASVGVEARNVIPASATASVDIRLAPGDDPGRMLRLVRQHLARLGYHVVDREPTAAERRAGRVARLAAHEAYPAARANAGAPIVEHLVEAATAAAGRPALTMPTLGGSVPLHHFTDVLGVPAVIVPIANPDNNQHAADENLRLGNLWYGIDLWSLLLTGPWAPAGERS